MTQPYRRKDDNHKKAKSYRQMKLEQNLWRCDCSDEGQHTDIKRHEAECNYGVWYSLNDMDEE